MDYGYGQRADIKQKKGMGYFGQLKRFDGGISTEISVGVGINGKETEIPLIVPSLTKKELDYLLNTPVKSKKFFDDMPPEILQKAIAHAKMRIDQDKSPFAGPDEITKAPK
jgi:hypothetical protein